MTSLRALDVPEEVINACSDFEMRAEAGGLVTATFTLYLVDGKWPKPKPTLDVTIPGGPKTLIELHEDGELEAPEDPPSKRKLKKIRRT